MIETQIRASLTEIFRDLGVFFLRDRNVEKQFIDGCYDANLEELNVDSLAAMEICIALEANWGATIVPDDLHRVGSLQALVNILRQSASID
jgi:acyl carrier protein